MANERVVLAGTDIGNLMGNLRGEVGEVITSWLLMRHFIGAGKRLESGDLGRDIQDKNIRFSHLMADKLSDELVGRLVSIRCRPPCGVLRSVADCRYGYPY